MDSLKPRFPEKKAQYVYSVSSIILTRSSAEPPPRYSIIIHNFVSYKTKKEENHFQNESRKFFFFNNQRVFFSIILELQSFTNMYQQGKCVKVRTVQGSPEHRETPSMIWEGAMGCARGPAPDSRAPGSAFHPPPQDLGRGTSCFHF